MSGFSPASRTKRPAANPVASGSGRRVAVFGGVVVLTVAATMVAAGLWMLRSAPTEEILEFRVRPYPEGRGHMRSFVVEFTLQEAGYPVLLHLDAEGRPSLLFPERDWISVGGRSVIRWPDPASGQAWILAGEPGEESFLLAVGRDRDADLEILVEEAERLAARSRTPRDARRRVREFFAKNVGPVREVGSETLES